MTTDQIIAVAAGALAASLVGFLGGLYGGWIQHQRDRKKWERDLRLESYLELIRVAERMPTTRTTVERFDRYLDDMRNAQASIRLVGPSNVNEAAIALVAGAMGRRLLQVHILDEPDANAGEDADAAVAQINKVYAENRDAFVAAAQEELKIGR